MAWKIVKATEKGSWKPYWLELLLTIPERAERQWLAMAVALVWVLTLGGEPLALSSDSSDTLESSSHSALNIARSLSCFVNGLLTIVARLLNGQSLAVGTLFPFHLNRFHYFLVPDSS